MLGKLIKYEFKASGRILLPIYAATVILALLSGIFCKVPDNFVGSVAFLKFITVLVIVLYSMFVLVTMAVSMIVSIYRFKINMFGTEGYIMHTLPVRTHTHITSKLIVSAIYEIIGVFVALISGMLFLMFTPFYKNLDFPVLLDEFAELMTNYSGLVIAYAIEVIIVSVSIFVCTNVTFFAALSVGHSANTKKVAKSILTYIVFHFMVQIINYIIIQLPIKYLFQGINFSATNEVHAVLIGVILLETFYTAIFYAITNCFMKKRLNLQ